MDHPLKSVKSGLTKNEERSKKRPKMAKNAENVAKNIFFLRNIFLRKYFGFFLQSVSRPGSDSEMKVKNQSLLFIVFLRFCDLSSSLFLARTDDLVQRGVLNVPAISQESGTRTKELKK